MYRACIQVLTEKESLYPSASLKLLCNLPIWSNHWQAMAVQSHAKNIALLCRRPAALAKQMWEAVVETKCKILDRHCAGTEKCATEYIWFGDSAEAWQHSGSTKCCICYSGWLESPAGPHSYVQAQSEYTFTCLYWSLALTHQLQSSMLQWTCGCLSSTL